jgi:hypothetical protein
MFLSQRTHRTTLHKAFAEHMLVFGIEAVAAMFNSNGDGASVGGGIRKVVLLLFQESAWVGQPSEFEVNSAQVSVWEKDVVVKYLNLQQAFVFHVEIKVLIPNRMQSVIDNFGLAEQLAVPRHHCVGVRFAAKNRVRVAKTVSELNNYLTLRVHVQIGRF